MPGSDTDRFMMESGMPSHPLAATPLASAPLAVRSLRPERAEAVRGLVAAAEAADGAPPLSEAFLLGLASTSGAGHLLLYAGSQLVGYAQLTDPDDPDSAAEIVVHPQHRREGIATALLSAMPSGVRIWAHGASAAATAFVKARGLTPVRDLHILGLTLDDSLPPAELPEGLVVRPFRPGTDEQAWVAVNAAAFASHPEQGRLTVADLRARMAQPWFDPAGLLMVVPSRAGEGPTVAGFHWTKVHDGPTDDPATRRGEVYAVAVHPAYQGRGLGRSMTLLGLHHLRETGIGEAFLYVDGDNEAARRTYDSLGFQSLANETMFTHTPPVVSGTMVPMSASADARVESEAPVPPLTEPLTAAPLGGRMPDSAAADAVEARPVVALDLPQERYLEREISWLQFNERVLQLAMDETVPLIERAKFLAIFSSNLDEFFMVRVAGLKRRIATGLAVRSAAGLEPRELLDRIQHAAQELMRMHSWVFWDQIRPALHEEGISIVRWGDLNEAERAPLHGLFREQIFPVLTPLAVDPAHPFPYISGLSLNLAVVLVNPKTGAEHFARVKVPPVLPRFLRVFEPGDDHGTQRARFIPLEDVIAVHLDQLFTGMEVREHYTFRVTRNEDLEVEEDDAENLLTALEKELTRRRFGPPVRLEVEDAIADRVLDLLTRELGVTEAAPYRLPAPLDLRGLFLLGDLDRSELKDPPFVPMTHPDLAPTERSQEGDLFAAIRSKDILLHHPYDSFSTSVQSFIGQAAADPRVLAIKQTLYRTSGDSPIIDALIDAATAGKQVLAVVEIKARFDEVNNISWARKLEHAGVHVVYGIVGLKTHAKLCLVVRQETEGLVRYCHVGTGNYNPKTARLYEDLGILTCDPQVGEDLSRLFNQLSGIAPRSRFRRLLVAPRTVRSGLIELVDAEIERHEADGGGAIRLKMNSIVDEQLIDALYRASQAGVPVDVWVRGICAIRPQVPGLSDNLRVRSTLGRFLEHSRIFWFAGGGSPQVYIGSADMMHRNLDRRVEALVQIVDTSHVAELTNMFNMGLADTTSRFELGADGTWTRVYRDADGQPLNDLQTLMWDHHNKARRKARRR